MNRPDVLIVDGAPLPHCDPERAKPARDWPPVLIKRDVIDREIERLADLPRPANGRRSALFVHPNAPDPGRGLTPGVQVALEVLKPGEQTVPIRHNSTQVNFCIRGRGTPSSAIARLRSNNTTSGIIRRTPRIGTATIPTICTSA